MIWFRKLLIYINCKILRIHNYSTVVLRPVDENNNPYMIEIKVCVDCGNYKQTIKE